MANSLLREAKIEMNSPPFTFEHNELSLLAGDLYKKISIGHIVYLNLIPDQLQPQTLLMVKACNQITSKELGGKLIVVLH